MPDINRDVSIEQVDYTIDVNNIEYSIEINPQQTFELQLNEQGPQGLTGPQGETGNGISTIAQTGTSGLTDTYTIYYTDGDTTTFDVTNGKDGEDGTDGQAATISVGTVSTGAAGTEATIVNSGTSSDAIFDFTIPRGDKGDTGATGATGISVTGVQLISTVGLVKTYRMSFSDGSYFDYTVSDGASGSTTWGGITGVLSNQTDLNNELTNLQTQIDAIVSSSDVFDIVGTYAELQAYDITTVPVNDIIKVLVDSTHGGAATYYRCTESGGVKSWTYIGSEGAYYTKGEADSLFALISDIPGLATTLQAGIVRPDGVTITIDSNGIISAAPATVIDNLSITENSSDELQTVGVIDQNNTSNAIKTWTGTKAQYDAILSKDAETLYTITDDITDNTSIVNDLNGKADVDLTNTTPTSAFATAMNSVGIVTIVETWHSGTDWYRIYSDGWCEQGGVISAVTTTLLKPYIDTNYIVLQGFVAGTDGDWFITNKTATSFTQKIKYYGSGERNSSTSNYWQACGYIR